MHVFVKLSHQFELITSAHSKIYSTVHAWKSLNRKKNMKYLDIYKMDWDKICFRQSWSPDDDSHWLWWSSDISSNTIIKFLQTSWHSHQRSMSFVFLSWLTNVSTLSMLTCWHNLAQSTAVPTASQLRQHGCRLLLSYLMTLLIHNEVLSSKLVPFHGVYQTDCIHNHCCRCTMCAILVEIIFITRERCWV